MNKQNGLRMSLSPNIFREENTKDLILTKTQKSVPNRLIGTIIKIRVIPEVICFLQATELFRKRRMMKLFIPQIFRLNCMNSIQEFGTVWKCEFAILCGKMEKSMW